MILALWLSLLVHVTCTFGQSEEIASSPQCISNYECSDVQACIDLKCQCPCPGICHSNSTCRVHNHVAYCSCTPGLTGDPFTGCKEQTRHLTEGCTKNDQCAQHLSCIDGDCQDPCAGLCGNNTVCRVSRHVPSCSCSKGFIGEPASSCHEPEKRFKLYLNKPLSWTEALVNCRNQGLQLLTLDNEEDFNKVYSLIKARENEFEIQIPAFWTSGVETYHDVYVWTSTGVPVTFTNWGAGDPNHYVHHNGPERCILLWPYFNYGMGDYNCQAKLYYVCQEYV